MGSSQLEKTVKKLSTTASSLILNCVSFATIGSVNAIRSNHSYIATYDSPFNFALVCYDL